MEGALWQFSVPEAMVGNTNREKAISSTLWKRGEIFKWGNTTSTIRAVSLRSLEVMDAHEGDPPPTLNIIQASEIVGHTQLASHKEEFKGLSVPARGAFHLLINYFY